MPVRNQGGRVWELPKVTLLCFDISEYVVMLRTLWLTDETRSVFQRWDGRLRSHGRSIWSPKWNSCRPWADLENRQQRHVCSLCFVMFREGTFGRSSYLPVRGLERSAPSSRSISLTVHSFGNFPYSPVCPLGYLAFSSWLLCWHVSTPRPCSAWLACLSACATSTVLWSVGSQECTLSCLVSLHFCGFSYLCEDVFWALDPLNISKLSLSTYVYFVDSMELCPRHSYRSSDPTTQAHQIWLLA